MPVIKVEKDKDDAKDFNVCIEDVMAIGKNWVSSHSFAIDHGMFHLSCNSSGGVFCFNVFYDQNNSTDPWLDPCWLKTPKLILSRLLVKDASSFPELKPTQLEFEGFMCYKEETEQTRFTLGLEEIQPLLHDGNLYMTLSYLNHSLKPVADLKSSVLILEDSSHEKTASLEWTLKDFDQLDSTGQTSVSLKHDLGNPFVVWIFKSTASRFCLEVYSTEDRKPVAEAGEGHNKTWIKLVIGDELTDGSGKHIPMETRRVFNKQRKDSVRFSYDWNRIKELVEDNQLKIKFTVGIPNF